MTFSTGSPDRRRVLRLIVIVVLFGQLLFVAAQLISMALSRYMWVADLANFIRLHLMIVGVGLFVIGVFLPARVARIGALLSLLAAILPYVLLPTQASNLGGNTFTVVSANVLVDNPDPSRFLATPDLVAAEILVLQEVRRSWQSALAASGHWEFESDRNLSASNEMKLFSRFPIVSASRVSPESTDTGGRHAQRFELSIEGKPVVLYAVHAQTPRSPSMWHERSAYLRDLQMAMQAERQDAAVIVAGDWNTPTWSPFFLDLLDATGYRTTEPRWWPLATRFSIRFGSITQLGVPIDRVVLSPHVGLEDIRTGRDFGSNHLPVIARLSLP